MNIKWVNIMLAVVIPVGIHYVIRIAGGREIGKDRVQMIKENLLLAGILPLFMILIFGISSIMTAAIAQDRYMKDNSIATIETRKIHNLEYTGDKYTIDNKYIVINSNNVHITSDEPYMTRIIRVQLGPFYCDTSDLLMANNIELYITKDIADRIEKIDENSIVYASTSE